MISTVKLIKPKLQILKYFSTKLQLQNEFRMLAWQIHSYGDVNELQLSRPRLPILTNSKEMLVKVKATSLNPIDGLMLTGYGRDAFNMIRKTEIEFPLTLGRDFSGYVLDKGLDVTKSIKVGDEVYGIVPLQRQGCHSEAVLVHEDNVRPKPKHLSHTEAGSLMYAAMSAWSALYIFGGMCWNNESNAVKRSTQRKVLILGASGGVGTIAVQLLKSQNIQVIATCASDASDMVQSLGADRVYCYNDPNYQRDVENEGRFDLIMDCAKIGYRNLPTSWSYQKYLTLSSPLIQNTDKYGIIPGLMENARDFLCSNYSKLWDGSSVRWGFFTPLTQGFDFLHELIAAQKIKPVLHKVYKFEELPRAYEALNAGHLRGKLVIDVE